MLFCNIKFSLPEKKIFKEIIYHAKLYSLSENYFISLPLKFLFLIPNPGLFDIKYEKHQGQSNILMLETNEFIRLDEQLLTTHSNSVL